MKIGFYLNNQNCKDIDFSKPNLGNPGVGGTEYMFSLISYYLCENKKNEVHIFAPYTSKFDKRLIAHKVESLEEAINEAEKSVDFLVCRSFGKTDYYKLLNNTNLKIVIWAHNFIKLKELDAIVKCDGIYKLVCVSKAQLEELNGHKVYNKSTYIYNAFVKDIYDPDLTRRKKSICYVGSIIPNKGFHICAKIWRKLYDEGYRIDLNVVGSGTLYNKDKKMGSYGIASQEYEDEFMNYLVDSNGKLIDKVNFYGLLGHQEKIDVLRDSYIGMPNPSGNTETFGISAIEMEAVGVPVVTGSAVGYKDTIQDKVTGYICKNENELIDKCRYLLNLKEEDYKKLSSNCIDYVSIFEIEKVVNRWQELFDETIDNQHSEISLLKKFKNRVNLIANYR